jgi:hypothetical protein
MSARLSVSSGGNTSRQDDVLSLPIRHQQQVHSGIVWERSRSGARYRHHHPELGSIVRYAQDVSVGGIAATLLSRSVVPNLVSHTTILGARRDARIHRPLLHAVDALAHVDDSLLPRHLGPLRGLRGESWIVLGKPVTSVPGRWWIRRRPWPFALLLCQECVIEVPRRVAVGQAVHMPRSLPLAPWRIGCQPGCTMLITPLLHLRAVRVGRTRSTGMTVIAYPSLDGTEDRWRDGQV